MDRREICEGKDIPARHFALDCLWRTFAAVIMAQKLHALTVEMLKATINTLLGRPKEYAEVLSPIVFRMLRRKMGDRYAAAMNGQVDIQPLNRPWA